VSAFIDGSAPSVNPGPDPDDDGPHDGPDDGYDHDGPDDERAARGSDARFEPALDEDDPDSGSAWLHEEIQRRIAAGRRASKGRHARHEVASSTTAISYVPRHSTATPGPGAQPPAPVATPARGIPRVETGWTSPPPTGGFPVVPPLEPAPPPGPEGHRRTMLAGGVVNVPVDRDPPPPYRSGDPLPAAAARRALERRGDPVVDGPPGAPDDPDAGQTKRVRVVLSERKGVARPVRTVVDIQENTGVGELLRSNLIGSQLTVALRFAVVAGLTLGVLPVLFWLFPDIGRTELLGIRLPWLLLGVLVYPYLVLMGYWHTRAAERVEQNFADHVQD
jgi:hypothetical protein